MDTQEPLFLPELPSGAVYDDVAGICRPAEDPLESLPPLAENPTSFAQDDPACSTHLISRNDHFSQPGVTRDYCLPHDPARDLCLDPSYQTNDRDGLLQSASCDPTQQQEGQLYVQHVLKNDPERVAVAVNEINQNPPPEGVEAVRQAVQVALQEVGSEGNAGKAAVTTFAQTVSDPELRRLAVAAAMGTTPPTREGTLASPGDESSSSAVPLAATFIEPAGCEPSLFRTAPVGAVRPESPQPASSYEVPAAPGKASFEDSSPGPALSISGIAFVNASGGSSETPGISAPIPNHWATTSVPDTLGLSRGAVPPQSPSSGQRVADPLCSEQPNEWAVRPESPHPADTEGVPDRSRQGSDVPTPRYPARSYAGSEGPSRHPARIEVASNETSDTGESPTFTPSQGLQPRGNEIDGAPVGMTMADGGEPDPYAVAFAPVPLQTQVNQRGGLAFGDGRRGGTSDNRAPQTIADKGHSSDHHGEDGMGDPDGRRRQGGGEDHPEEGEDPQYALAPEEEAETPPAA